ncbi:MAG: N-acetylmuramic acid 6-phosphate etherase [Candidatus Dormibacteraceae bacterium]
MRFTLRSASPEKALRLAGVLVAACRAAYREFAPGAVLDALDPETLARQMKRDWDACETVVATGEQDDVLGFIRYRGGGPGSGFVRSLYVLPPAAGQGVGSALLGHAVERLGGAGRAWVSLWVFEQNVRGRRFCERHGFRPTEMRRIEPPWGTPVVRYLRPALAPAGVGSDDEVLVVTSPTEERNPRTVDIDRLPVLPLLERINDEDARVAAAVRRALPAVAQLVEATLERLARGGRVHYFGAGSSGRMAMLDAADLPPTFGVPANLFVAHLAGGDGAVRRAREGSEDDADQGASEAAAVVGEADIVIGIAASGYTRYVGGALRAARQAGASTALVTSNPSAPLNTFSTALAAAGNQAKTALVMLLAGVSTGRAREAVTRAEGVVTRALAELGGTP